MNRGIAYLFAYSLGFAERIAVSLFTLRQHWHGPITIFSDDQCGPLAEQIAADPQIAADVKRIDVVRGPRHSCYITKTLIPTWSPYDKTLLIDGDTTIHGPLDALFDPPMAVTQFSEWQSQGRIMSGRIRCWRKKTPAINALVEKQLEKSWPAVNTGVIGWHRGHRQLPVWHTITQAGAGLHMTDELAMQLLSGAMSPDEYRVFDDRYNCSPLYGVHRDVAVIWHYHGSKHLRHPAGRKLWEPCFRSAVAANVGGLVEWAGRHDAFVAKIL